ncbi:putative leader peptide [Pseudonocardia sp.]
MRWAVTWRRHGRVTAHTRRHVDLRRVSSALCPR